MGATTANGCIASILVIDDDVAFSTALCSFLRLRGYKVTPCYSGAETRLRIDGTTQDGFPFDIVLCDRMLPDVSGDILISLIRSRSDSVPIIVVSAREAVNERVYVLRLGADDYIVKPFSFEELLARIEVGLRRANGVRSGGEGSSEEQLVYKDWVANRSNRRFTAAGNPVPLTRTEFDIVALFMRSPGRVFTRADVLSAVCKNDEPHDERAVDSHLSHVRKKIKAAGSADYIKTVWGVGFILDEQ